MNDERLGRYLVGPEIGRGGMSVVYRGTDPALGRDVALKVLHPHLAAREDSRARFSREARAVARLHHPNIVEVYDFAPPESERAYIVTELIEGPTLRQFVQEHPIRHGELAAMLMIPVLRALEHAHESGIVHRDVKPENIMIRPDGSPVLMDFGIAQMVDMETLTATGTMLGSPAHMAPEVVDGTEVEHPADVFSVGTVLYWLVCGALPFSGPNPAALFRRLLECEYDPVLQRRPQAGRHIARLIERCLVREPEGRPTAAEIRRELEALLRHAGLEHLEAELAALRDDPEVYQDALGPRMVPGYLEVARGAYAARETARALSYLNRVLTLDEEHEAATALLARIERGQRRGWLLRGAFASCALALAGFGLWGLWGDGPSEEDAGFVAIDAVQDAAARDALPEDAAPRDAVSEDAALRDAVVVDARIPDARPKDAARRRPRPRPRPKPPRDAGLGPAKTYWVQVKVGALKGARVFLDGRFVGYGSMVEANQKGLQMTAGQHTIRFTSGPCYDDEQTFEVRSDRRTPTIRFRCTYKPALLKVTSNQDTLVFDPAGKLLGRTNQLINLPMGSRRRSMTLTIGDPTAKNGVKTVPVTLTPGAETPKIVRVTF